MTVDVTMTDVRTFETTAISCVKLARNIYQHS